ncbi:hypothetical protein [Kocuria rosea]|uniref:hypothetical protein n=1 Tax=Kocuria rosea TaxID=1275 RepID=UPI000F82E198|nr:hypothetical protein [Kocuria rosea]
MPGVKTVMLSGHRDSALDVREKFSSCTMKNFLAASGRVQLISMIEGPGPPVRVGQGWRENKRFQFYPLVTGSDEASDMDTRRLQVIPNELWVG